MARNTIMLRSDLGVYQNEAVAGAALYPGQICKLNGSGQLVPNDQTTRCERLVVLEDKLQGKLVTDVYASGDVAFYHILQPGDEYQGRIALNQTLTNLNFVTSDASGNHVVAPTAAAGETIIGKMKEAVTTGGSLYLLAPVRAVG